MMTLATLLSWGGCALLLIGLKLIGDKRASGFWVALVAEAMWIAWGVTTGAWALVAMSAVIMAMYVRALVLWKAGEGSNQ
jgi:hypothetical protein